MLVNNTTHTEERLLVVLHVLMMNLLLCTGRLPSLRHRLSASRQITAAYTRVDGEQLHHIGNMSPFLAVSFAVPKALPAICSSGGVVRDGAATSVDTYVITPLRNLDNVIWSLQVHNCNTNGTKLGMLSLLSFCH